MTKDHLGSTAVVSDSSGALVFAENFSAFGIQRDTTWGVTGTFPNIATVSQRGFTSEEMLQNIGHVNLNGRLLNYSNGRMISPDPYVPDPGNTQSFNRYSYVNNRPLTLTDPSGFDPIFDGITVIASSGGPENPVGDVLAIADVVGEFLGFSGFFSASASESPTVKLEESHGISPSAQIPQITVTGQHLTTAAHFGAEGLKGVAEVMFAPSTASAIAQWKNVEPDSVHVDRIRYITSQDPDNQLDQIIVEGIVNHGFNPLPFVPLYSLGVCIYYGCGPGHWAIAAIGSVPGGSWEFGSAKAGSYLFRGVANGHDMIDAARAGTAVPRNLEGALSAAEHNAGRGLADKSVYLLDSRY